MKKHNCNLFITKKGKITAGRGKFDSKGKWEIPCIKCTLKARHKEIKFLRNQVEFLEKRQLSTITKRVVNWVVEAFGEDYQKDKKARCLRLIEEAAELAQTQDVPKEQLHNLIEHVYSKDKGEYSQELAGCLTTICSAAGALGEDLYYVYEKEINRVEQPEIMEKCRLKNMEKRKNNL